MPFHLFNEFTLFNPDVIFLFTCRWMRARKVQIICKASGRRSRFRLICRVDYNDNISWVNKTIYQNLPSVPMKQPWLTPGRNCGVKTHSAMSSIIFFFAHSAVCCLLISLLWPPCIIYLSVFPAWLFLSLGSWGEIKQTPILKLTGSPKSEPEGSTSPPFPAQPQPDRGRVRQRCSLLQASRGGKKETLRGGLFGVPLTP